ncbi:MAG: peptidylprolyl isomerase [Croceibacterium sp.]
MRLALAAALLALPATTLAQEAAEPVTPASVVAAAPASAWKPIDPADLLVMDLAPDAAGEPRRVVIQLMPPPFSQGWVENIRKLAKAHWWDGTSVYRVVDNWVAQWGDVDETKALPEGVSERPESEYSVPLFPDLMAHLQKLGSEFAPPSGEADLDSLPNAYFQLRSDSYAPMALHHKGWPVAIGSRDNHTWPTHCYGAIGVARSVGSGGTGSELYAVIGHAPRQLDRNIGIAGRVIEGIEHLSVLQRGTGDAGVYMEAEERTPILSARLGTDMPDPPRFEYLDTESASFGEYVRLRANRHDSFYLHPAGGIDVCNVQIPIRRVPAE